MITPSDGGATGVPAAEDDSELDHPRPLLQRPWHSLDGSWDFAVDSDLIAEDPGRVAFDRRIVVPFAPETPASGLALEGRLGRVWYRRRLPAAAPGRRCLLHFGAVDRVATVWIGGVQVATHEGGYTPWSVDVTDQTRDGDAELVVRVDDDPADIDAPRGKQDWLDRPHAIWYPRTTGIWRTVWLEHAAAARVEDVRWIGHQRPMTLTAAVRMTPEAVGHRLRLRIRLGSRLLAEDTLLVTQPEMTRTLPVGDGGADDRDALVWHPAHPVLLQVELALLDRRGEVVDEVDSYAAVRDVGVEEGRFLLNGRPFPLRLVLDQGYWPGTGATPPGIRALRRDVELVRSLGFTGVRKHQKTEDPRFLAAADRAGLLVWAEMPSPQRFGDRAARRLLAEWPEVVTAHRGHPSVVGWVPLNESWGVDGAERDPQQAALVRALAEMTHALDGTRPVSANDGWETAGGQLLGVHDYEQDPAVLRARYGDPAALDRFLARRRFDGRLSDLDRAGAGGRAVVLSEFGGVALRSEPRLADGVATWGYDEVGSPEELVARYRELWAAVHDSDVLAGACWTQLTDTYQEANGLLRADRTPKADVEALAAATRGARRP